MEKKKQKVKEKTCLPAHWLLDNKDLKADNCIIKTEAETPEKCWRQRMLLSKSNSSPTVPFKFCLSDQNTLRLELFQSKNRQISVSKYHFTPFNQGFYIERVWTDGTVSYDAC